MIEIKIKLPHASIHLKNRGHCCRNVRVVAMHREYHRRVNFCENPDHNIVVLFYYAIFKVFPTLWRCFFLNIGAIGLNFSTHNQFGLKFKFTKFSLNLVAMVTKKTRWPSWI